MRSSTKSRDVTIQLEASLTPRGLREEPALLLGQVPTTCIFLISHLGIAQGARSVPIRSAGS